MRRILLGLLLLFPHLLFAGGFSDLPVRFAGKSCIARVLALSKVRQTIRELVDMRVAFYLGDAFSSYALATGFERLANGRALWFYPDLPQVAALLKHLEGLHLRGTPAVLTGMRDPLLHLVSLPIKEFEVRYFTSAQYRAGMARSHTPLRGFDVVHAKILHTDQTRSHFVASRFTHETEPVINNRNDYRLVANTFYFSHGPNAPAQVLMYKDGGRGASEVLEIDPEGFESGIESQISSGDWQEATSVD